MAIEDADGELGSATHPLLPEYPTGSFATPALNLQRTPMAVIDSVTRVSFYSDFCIFSTLKFWHSLELTNVCTTEIR